jgi:CBS-domain-containing membrane protein
MMKRKEEFTSIKMISLIIFVLVLILINSLSIHVLALNEDSATTTPPPYDSELINNENNSMMLPGSNMTFVSSLDNAKMHLMDAIIDIKNNNIDGALMQLNMTSNDIKMHEREMADMMLMINKMKEVDKK